MYAGSDDTVALLETAFHDIHHMVADRVIYEAQVRNWGLAYIRLPRELRFVDLRDPALAELGIGRDELVSTSAEHYPCTRRWSIWLHGETVAGERAQGLIWSSRQAELARGYMFSGVHHLRTTGL